MSVCCCIISSHKLELTHTHTHTHKHTPPHTLCIQSTPHPTCRCAVYDGSLCNPIFGQINVTILARCATLRLTMELTNSQDPFAVAVIKDGCVVGHAQRTVSPMISFFLGKDGSVGLCEATGAMVNRAAVFGLDIPCVYRFYGRLAYIERLRSLLQ